MTVPLADCTTMPSPLLVPIVLAAVARVPPMVWVEPPKIRMAALAADVPVPEIAVAVMPALAPPEILMPSPALSASVTPATERKSESVARMPPVALPLTVVDLPTPDTVTEVPVEPSTRRP